MIRTAIKYGCSTLRRFRRNTAGSFMMLAALSLTGLLGITGLAIDGGRAMLERDRMQNAADLAALAATSTYKEKINAGALPPSAYTAALATANRFYAANAGVSLANSRNVTFGLVPSTAPGTLPGFGAVVTGDVDTTFSRVLN